MWFLSSIGMCIRLVFNLGGGAINLSPKYALPHETYVFVLLIHTRVLTSWVLGASAQGNSCRLLKNHPKK